jgi:two-component system sensor histidine kinase KdpD
VGHPLETARSWRDRLWGSIVGADDGEDVVGLQAPPPLQAYVFAVATVVVCTVVSWLVSPRFDPRNLAMVYLLGVAFVATRVGGGPAALASCLSVASLEFFFMPPYFQWTTDDPQYVFTFAVMLLVALLISRLASRVREQARQARQRERRTQILYAMTRELAALSRPQDLADAAARHLSGVFNAQATVRLSVDGRPADDASAAGGDDAIRLPFPGGRGVVGVAALHPNEGLALTKDSLELLETLTRQIAVSVERAQLAEQAEKAELDVERERLRNALLSSVSHDLRTPLSVITGAASSLVGDATLSGEARVELSATIYEESEHLNRLVGNLLDMTRVEAGELRVAKEWHSLEEIVGTAVRRLKKVLREHVVWPRLPPDLPLVPLDAVLIEQVFVNLLENAAKYTPKGSRIEIAAVRGENTVTVEVADAGPGLPPGDIGRLFEKFQHGGRGGGLGLAICRAIVLAHGGEITARNRPSGGAVFALALPLIGAGSAYPTHTEEADEPR